MRDPLLHFAVLGGLIFLLWSWRDDGGDGLGASNGLEASYRLHIVVDEAEQKLMVAAFASQWRRLPDPAEFSDLLDRHVRDEVLMREALALGLDQGDRVIRQRLAQKLEMTLAEIAALEVPGEAELRAFHAARLDTYTAPARVSFTHRFLDAKRHGDDLPQAAQSLARALGAGETAAGPPAGDPFHAPLALTEANPEQLARVFGPGFRDALLQLAEEAGAAAGWSNPLASPWGLHLVRIDAYAPARLEEFDEVRERVLADWRRDAVERAQASRIDAMRARYTVEIAPADFLFEP